MEDSSLKILSAIQVRLDAPKSQYNKFGKYPYRNCEDILEALKPLIEEYSSPICITDAIVEIGGRIYVKATASIHIGSEVFSAEAFAREEESKKGMDSAQLTGSTSSYARKYALNGLFCIDDNKDADSGKNNQQEKRPAQRENHSQSTEDHAANYKLVMSDLQKFPGDKADACLEHHKKNIAVMPTTWQDAINKYAETRKDEISASNQ